MNTQQLTPKQANTDLYVAIHSNNRKKALDLISPDDRDILPDWEEASDEEFDTWNNLVDQAMDKFDF